MVPEPQFILVTGGTGFLGSHIVQQLLEGGYNVRCTARPLKTRFLETAHLERVRAGQLEVVEINDLAQEDLKRVLAGITAVIHTASPAPGSMDDTQLLLDATSSTTSLLRQAYEHGIRKCVLTSSYLAMVGASVNGGSDNSDDEDGEGMRDTGVWSDYVFGDLDWTHATYESVFTGKNDPAWAYTAAKTLAEAAAWDFASAKPDFDLTTVLPTLLLGPFAPGHAILSISDLSTNVLLHSLLTSGTPPHPIWPHFVDVRDAARAHVKALAAPILGDYVPVAPASTHASNQSGLRQGTRTVKGLDKSHISRQSQSRVLSPSSNPSLVDLGKTLETSFQTTLESHLSQFPTTVTPESAQNATSPPSSDPLDPPSPSSSRQRTSTSSNTSTTKAKCLAIPRKRLIATGASFTWPDVILHLRAVRPDLSESLPDERACFPIPETVAGVEGGWSGAAWARAVKLRGAGGVRSQEEGVGEGAGGSRLEREGGPVWSGLDIRWRDWRETVEDAVRDLERVAGNLQQSGWEDLFADDEEEEDDDETRDAGYDDEEKGS